MTDIPLEQLVAEAKAAAARQPRDPEPRRAARRKALGRVELSNWHVDRILAEMAQRFCRDVRDAIRNLDGPNHALQPGDVRHWPRAVDFVGGDPESGKGGKPDGWHIDKFSKPGPTKRAKSYQPSLEYNAAARCRHPGCDDWAYGVRKAPKYCTPHQANRYYKQRARMASQSAS